MNTDLPNPQFVYIRIIPSANRSFIIDELIQFTNYNVELAAVTIGDGEFSDPRTVRTDQDSECALNNYTHVRHIIIYSAIIMGKMFTCRILILLCQLYIELRVIHE